MALFDRLYFDVDNKKWKEKGIVARGKMSQKAQFDFRINPIVLNSQLEIEISTYIQKLSRNHSLSNNEKENILYSIIFSIQNDIILSSDLEDVKNIVNEMFFIYNEMKTQVILDLKKIKYTMISENKKNYLLLDKKKFLKPETYYISNTERTKILSFEDKDSLYDYQKSNTYFKNITFDISMAQDNKLLVCTKPLLSDYQYEDKSINYLKINYFDFLSNFNILFEVDINELETFEVSEEYIATINESLIHLKDEDKDGYRRFCNFKKISKLEKNISFKNTTILAITSNSMDSVHKNEESLIETQPYNSEIRRVSGLTVYNKEIDRTKYR